MYAKYMEKENVDCGQQEYDKIRIGLMYWCGVGAQRRRSFLRECYAKNKYYQSKILCNM